MENRSAQFGLRIMVPLVFFALLARPAHAFRDVLFSDGWFEIVGTLAVGLLVLSRWLARRKEQKDAEAGVIVPQQSWRKNKAWVRGVVPCRQVGLIVGAIVLGVIAGFIIVSALMGARFPGSPRDVWFFPMLAIIAVLLLFGLTSGGYLFVKWRWHGSSKFVMTIVPGIVGGPLLGVIHVTRKLAPRDGFHLRLVCTDHYARRKVLREYQLKVQALTDAGDGQTRIPVAFAVPYDAPQTTMNLGLLYQWSLQVTADTPWIRYKATFQIPIVITELSRQDFDLETMCLEEYLPAQP